MVGRRIGAASLARLLGEWRLAGSRGAAYRQLAGALRLLILDGRIGLGLRLPGERQLAAELSLSRTTVSAAYDTLREQGFIESRHGSGSRATLPRGPGTGAEPPPGGEPGEGVLDFSIGAVPAGDAVQHAFADAVLALPAYLPGTGYEPIGLPALRSAVADLYAARGVATDPDQILVTHGAHNAFALLLRHLAGPGDRVVIDHPTYALAIDAIRQASCRPVPVALPNEGWDVQALDTTLRQTAPRLAYVQPDFHNPTGRCMDEATRRALAGAAALTRTYLVSDETMSELWLEAPPPPPLAAYDEAAQVISLGSTGKTFWGGLRVGWIRADAPLVAALARTRASLDLGTPVLEQLAVVALLSGSEAPLERRRAQLRTQRDLVLDLAARWMPEWRLTRPAGGLSIWAELPYPCATALAAAAEAQGVRIGAGPRFGVDGAFERFVRLPFSLDPERLETAMERLAAAWARIATLVAPRATAPPAERAEPMI